MLLLKYLNILKVIMYACKLNVVDRKTIENQFGYLVKAERDGSVVLVKKITIANIIKIWK